MVCDFCKKNEAVIYLEQISNDGQKRKINICMDCAIERGISTDPTKIKSSVGNLFKELAALDKKTQAETSRACPVCGISDSTIKKKGITGCPECYSVFKEEIDSYLSSNNISGKYTGSMPIRLANFKSVLNDRIALKNKLNDAIKKEDYEKAAMYRDFLRALSKNAVSSSEDVNEFSIKK